MSTKITVCERCNQLPAITQSDWVFGWFCLDCADQIELEANELPDDIPQPDDGVSDEGFDPYQNCYTDDC